MQFPTHRGPIPPDGEPGATKVGRPGSETGMAQTSRSDPATGDDVPTLYSSGTPGNGTAPKGLASPFDVFTMHLFMAS